MPKRDGTLTFTEEMFERLEKRIAELRNVGFTIPEPLKRQVPGNTICIDPNNSKITTEFGDFHIPLAGCHIIVEIDGSGIDLTNLIKHWYTLHTHFNNNPVDRKPITLLCVYTQKDGDDLHSREIYWDFLYYQIRQDPQYVNRFDAKRYPVHIKSSDQDKETDIQIFLEEFVTLLRKHIDDNYKDKSHGYGPLQLLSAEAE